MLRKSPILNGSPFMIFGIKMSSGIFISRKSLNRPMYRKSRSYRGKWPRRVLLRYWMRKKYVFPSFGLMRGTRRRFSGWASGPSLPPRGLRFQTNTDSNNLLIIIQILQCCQITFLDYITSTM